MVDLARLKEYGEAYTDVVKRLIKENKKKKK